MTFTGMDTAQMRMLADGIDAAVNQLTRRAERLGAGVAGSEGFWRGPDGDDLRRSYLSVDRDLLQNLIDRLADAGRALRGQAAEQDSASTPVLPPAPSNPWLLHTGSAGPVLSSGAGPVLNGAGPVPSAAGPVLPARVSDPRSWLFATLAEAAWREEEDEARDFRRDMGHVLGMITRDDPDDPVRLVEAAATALVGAGAVTTSALPVIGDIFPTVLDEGRLDPALETVPLAARADDRAPGGVHELVTGTGQVGGGGGPVERAFGGSQPVRVEQLVGNDGGTRWIVTMPGTQSPLWAPAALGGSSQPSDWQSNLRMMAGQRTVAMDAVEASMAAAGIRPDEPVLFVGHSQGGIIASHLAAEPGFIDRYGVEALVVAGAPVGTADIPAAVSALSLEHGRFEAGVRLAGPGGPAVTVSGDLVPELDLMGDHTIAEHVNTVRLDPIVGELDTNAGDGDLGLREAFVDNHHWRGYADSLERLASDPASDPVAVAERDPALAQFLDGQARSIGATEYRGRRL